MQVVTGAVKSTRQILVRNGIGRIPQACVVSYQDYQWYLFTAPATPRLNYAPPPWDRSLPFSYPACRASFHDSCRTACGRLLPVRLGATTTTGRPTRAIGRSHLTLEKSCIAQPLRESRSWGEDLRLQPKRGRLQARREKRASKRGRRAAPTDTDAAARCQPGVLWRGASLRAGAGARLLVQRVRQRLQPAGAWVNAFPRVAQRACPRTDLSPTDSPHL